METTIPGEACRLAGLALLGHPVIDHEPWVPQRIIDDMLTVHDLDVLWLIEDLVVACLFIFLFDHNEHRPESLLEVGLALDSQILWVIHYFGQQDPFLQVQTIHLLLQPLFPHMWSNLKSELVDFRDHERRRPIVLFGEHHVFLLRQPKIDALAIVCVLICR